MEQFLFEANKTWHGVKVGQPDWSPSSHSLAFSAEIPKEKLMFYIAFNSYWEELEFELPLMEQWPKIPGVAGLIQVLIRRRT